MNWFHVHTLLVAQLDKHFPIDDARAFALEIKAAKKWGAIEKLLRAHELATHSEINATIREFIHLGIWKTVDAKRALWINARLWSARRLTLRLTIPVTDQQLVTSASETEVFEWLLITQWEVFGLNDWLTDLKWALQKGGSSSGASLFLPS